MLTDSTLTTLRNSALVETILHCPEVSYIGIYLPHNVCLDVEAVEGKPGLFTAKYYNHEDMALFEEFGGTMRRPATIHMGGRHAEITEQQLIEEIAMRWDIDFTANKEEQDDQPAGMDEEVAYQVAMDPIRLKLHDMLRESFRTFWAVGHEAADSVALTNRIDNLRATLREVFHYTEEDFDFVEDEAKVANVSEGKPSPSHISASYFHLKLTHKLTATVSVWSRTFSLVYTDEANAIVHEEFPFSTVPQIDGVSELAAVIDYLSKHGGHDLKGTGKRSITTTVIERT